MKRNYGARKFRVFVSMLLIVIMFMLPGRYYVSAAEAGIDEYAGYIYFTVEKITLGQGFIIEPVRAGFYKDDSIAAITERVLGKMSTYEGNLSSYYLQGVKDYGDLTGWSKSDIPAAIAEAAGGDTNITKRNESAVLSSGDYCDSSSWLFSLNNNGIQAGAGSYGYKSETYSYDNNDVVRLQFSVFGWGRDTNTWDSSWGSNPLIDFPDKDELIKLAADYKGDKSSKVYLNAIKVLSMWDASAEIIEKTCDDLRKYVRDEEQKLCKDAELRTISYLRSKVESPVVSSNGGEWSVIALARGEISDINIYSNYYANLVKVLRANKSSKLSTTKGTENSRVILALTAIGANPLDVEGYNLLEPLADMNYVVKQGITGAAYALLAVDSGKYTIPEVSDVKEQSTRNGLIDYILNNQLDGGGWSLIGSDADVDTTALIVNALASYAKSNQKVNGAVNAAVEVLSNKQCSSGGFMSFDAENAESTAQVICALSKIGQYEDDKFIKDGRTPVVSLLDYFDKESGAFSHIIGGKIDLMATEQAAYSLVAYNRMKSGKSALFDMADDDIKPMYDIDLVNKLLTPESSVTPGVSSTPAITLEPSATAVPSATAAPSATAVPSATAIPNVTSQPTDVVTTAPVFSYKGLNYKITGKKTAACTGFSANNGNAKRTVIPAKVRYRGVYYKVTSVADKAFKDNKNIRQLYLGKNIKTVGKQSFCRCSKLKKITFDSKNIIIKTRTFFGISSKVSVFISSKGKNNINIIKKVFGKKVNINVIK